MLCLLGFLCIWVSFLEPAEGSYLAMEKSCPAHCICTRNLRKVQCVSKSLKAVPNDLPKSTVFMDISRNKNIQIPKTFFMKFTNLKHLNVENCNLQRHFDLPKKLMSIMIQNNKLSSEQLRLMFSNSSHFLRNIDARNNDIEISTRISLFGNNTCTRELYLSGNIMPIL